MAERVIVVGGTGLIGSNIVAAMRDSYDVVPVTRSTTPAMDITDQASIQNFFETIGPFDHVVIAAGDAAFAPLDQLDHEQLMVGVRSKLLGQLEAALAALRLLPDNGSITLTSGVLADKPIPSTAGVAFVNGAINSFVRAAALEMSDGRRINAVSPGWIKETMERMGMDSSSGMAAKDVAQMFLKSVQGDANGAVIQPAG